MNAEPKFCRSCGAPLAAGSTFCDSCGQPVLRRADQPLDAFEPATPIVPPTVNIPAPPEFPSQNTPPAYYVPPPSLNTAENQGRSGGNARKIILIVLAVVGLCLCLCVGGIAGVVYAIDRMNPLDELFEGGELDPEKLFPQIETFIPTDLFSTDFPNLETLMPSDFGFPTEFPSLETLIPTDLGFPTDFEFPGFETLMPTGFGFPDNMTTPQPPGAAKSQLPPSLATPAP